MKILVITSEYYGSPNRIGSHHLAKQLAFRGWDVLVMSFPISPLYALASKATRYPERRQLSKNMVIVNPGIKVFVPNTVVPPVPALVRIAPFLLNTWHRFTNPNLRKVLDQFCGGQVDMVLVDTPFFPFLDNFLEIGKLIFRIADHLQGFWGSNKPLIRAEKFLLRRADIVVASSKLLAQKLSREHEIKVEYLSNGVDFSAFAGCHDLPVEYLESSRHKAIYVGSLKSWFDMHSLVQVARLRSNWDFFVIGSGSRAASKVRQSNVHFLGAKPAGETIPYLQHADAGIIPFDIQRAQLVNYINPLKLYEYLAAGIPVVSSNWPELDLLDAPIITYSSPQEFALGLDSALQDSPDKRDARRAFSRNHDWSRITDQLLKLAEES